MLAVESAKAQAELASHVRKMLYLQEAEAEAKLGLDDPMVTKFFEMMNMGGLAQRPMFGPRIPVELEI